jgi:hypothetical protein
MAKASRVWSGSPAVGPMVGPVAVGAVAAIAVDRATSASAST